MDGEEKEPQKVSILSKNSILTLSLMGVLLVWVAYNIMGVWTDVDDELQAEIYNVDTEVYSDLQSEILEVVEKYKPIIYEIVTDEELKSKTTYISIDVSEYPSERDVTVLLTTFGEYGEVYKNYTFLNDRSVVEYYTVGLLEVENGKATNFDYIDKNLHNRLIEYRK